ncbi:MAG: PQQ-binding-like beta-propeller repeat protein [Candidatus Micrarchaeota archaeon]|nr:PQQ-binding-like beta-propeller repeat protein [Candidatus Micrarchaeota archaeon]
MEFDDFNIEIINLGVKEKSNGLRWDHEFGGTIACVAASDGNNVYFGSDNHIFYAVDVKTGKEIWRYETGGCLGNATPVLYENMIFFGSYDGYLYCVDKETGNLIFRFKTGGKVVSGPTVTNERIVFGSRDGYIYCINHDGNELWRFRTGDEIISTPTIIGNHAYIGSYDCNMYCIDIESGLELWRFRTGGGITNLPPVNVHKDYIYFGSWDFSVYCINRHTGKLVWQAQTGGGMIQGGRIYDNVLYIGTRNNNTFYALDAYDGHILWEFKAEVHLHTSNVDIYDNKIYVGGGEDNYGPGVVYCLTKEGKLIWKKYVDGPTWAGPSIRNGMVFVGSWNCKMYRIDPETGKDIWIFTASGAPSNEKVVDINKFEVETVIAKDEIEEANDTSNSYSSIPEPFFQGSEYGVRSEYGSGSEYSSGDTRYK